MRILLFPIGALLALTGCQPVGDVAQTTLSSSEPSSASVRPVPASLTGEYRVAGIDGTEIGGGIGIALTVTDSEMWFDPRCAGFSWRYSHEAGALAIERAWRPGMPVCRIAVHPEQQRLADALDQVTEAVRLPSGALELRGGGRSVTLFTQ